DPGLGIHAVKTLRRPADDRTRVPIASLTMAEREIREIGADACTGHILSATYFQKVENEANARFVGAFKARFGQEFTT
ncbi:transporter substrate-binding protein, partial [Rhizobium ruizarguesonis]